MEIKPTRGKYLCEVLEDVKQLPSGLFIADAVKEVPHRALVLAVGEEGISPKGKKIRQSSKIGDIVHFKRVWHRERKAGKSMKIFLKEEEILAIE